MLGLSPYWRIHAFHFTLSAPVFFGFFISFVPAFGSGGASCLNAAEQFQFAENAAQANPENALCYRLNKAIQESKFPELKVSGVSQKGSFFDYSMGHGGDGVFYFASNSAGMVCDIFIADRTEEETLSSGWILPNDKFLDGVKKCYDKKLEGLS